jgi:hypothetical protein
MAAKEVAKQEIHVGKEVVVEGASPSPPFVAVFEDDGETGYFYALDTTRGENPILDALHIYDVESVTDKHLPSNVQIVWSMDDRKVALLINGYPHAVFDFTAKRGYCRSGFPPPSEHEWSAQGHEWDDAVLKLFA